MLQQTAEKAVLVAGSFLNFSLIARIISKEDMATFSYMVTMSALVGVFAALGLNDGFPALKRNFRGREDELISTVFFLRLISSICVSVLVLLYMRGEYPIGCAIALYVLIQPIGFVEAVVIEAHNGKILLGARMAVVLAGLASRFLGWKFGWGATEFLYSFALENLAGIVVIVVAATRCRMIPIRLTVHAKAIAEVAKAAAPMAALAGLTAILFRIENVIVMHLLPLEKYAEYAIAQKFSSMASIALTTLQAVVSPIYSSSYSSAEGGRDAERHCFKLASAFGWMLAAGVIIASSILVPMAFGEKYLNSVGPTFIFAFSYPLLALGIVRHQWFILNNKTYYAIPMALIGVLINANLCILLIPIFSTKGAAIACLLGHLGAMLSGLLMGSELRALTRRLLIALASALVGCGLLHAVRFVLSYRRHDSADKQDAA